MSTLSNTTVVPQTKRLARASTGRVIATTLALAVILMALYHMLIAFGLLQPSPGATQWETNIIKSERYLAEREPARLVLVGSSLTNNIPLEKMSRGVVNLGLAGGAPQTGLEIVARNPVKPAVVIVELNDTIRRQADTDMIDSLFSPTQFQLRQALPMFRQEYRPISVFINLIRTRGRTPNTALREAERKVENSARREQSVARINAEQAQPLSAEDVALMRAEAETIKQHVAALRQAGTRVVLVDIPRDSAVAETARQASARTLLHELFPADQFEWMPEPPAREWLTEDGQHLIPADAQFYAKFLREQLGM